MLRIGYRPGFLVFCVSSQTCLSILFHVLCQHGPSFRQTHEPFRQLRMPWISFKHHAVVVECDHSVQILHLCVCSVLRPSFEDVALDMQTPFPAT